uniref:Putative kat8 regulatory nsl complex subunit 3 n=1 Tax=Anopheles triannulatus TaxID=58253 RepID=A0A2M4A3S7_9DIPT
MEHSYMRDVRLLESPQTAKTRTLMVHRPPQCPSCHSHADERIDLEESYNPPIPSYNEESARKAMQESENIIAAARKAIPDDEDWEERVNKFGWSVQQFKLFDRVARLLDMDRLARLTNTDKQHEPVHRRTVIDKSVSRLRQALASVSWETRLTQWLHSLLVENLPPSYLAIYVDVLQTLQAKLPDLVNKMIFCHPQNNVGQELLGTILKKPWEPIVANKNRKLPGQPYIIVVPSGPYFAQPSARMQKWYNLFSTMASVIPIPGPTVDATTSKQTLQSLAERMVAETREKIQEIRKPAPNRPIILVGFNAGAAHAIQIGLVETVSCVVCLGFSYHTYNGPRGAPNDHIVDITSPVLFVVGQNSARASHEEIEMLRDRMNAQTSLVVVGSADECLRVSKTKRKIEGVTQSMTDNMVADEIADFATSCLLNPQGIKKSGHSDLKINGPLTTSTVGNVITLTSNYRTDSQDAANQRKRKQPPPPAPQTVGDAKYAMGPSSKQAKKIVQPIKPSKAAKGTFSIVSTSQSQEALDMAIQSILPATSEKPSSSTIVGNKVIEPFNRNMSRSDTMDNATLGSKKDVQVVSGLASTPLMLPKLKRDTSSTATHGTVLDGQAQAGNMNVKLIASNQLIQLKPSVGTTQKFYTLKSNTTKPVVSVVSGSPGSEENPQAVSPSKFMILRSTGQVITSPGDTPAGSKLATSSDLTGTNIFDMPIVFADNDGFIDDSAKEGATSKASSNKATVTSDQMIVVNSSTPPVAASETVVTTTPTTAPQLTSNRFVTLQPASTTGKTNKIVLINSIKPVDGSILLPGSINLSNVGNVSTASSSGANQGGVKYTKVVLTAGKVGTPLTKNISQLLSSGKVEIVNNSAVKPPSTSTPVTLQQGKFIINTSKTISNIPTTATAAGGTSTTKGQIIGGNKILIKTTGGGTTTATGLPSLVGRNVTLKRLNIVPSAPATKPTATATTTATVQKGVTKK